MDVLRLTLCNLRHLQRPPAALQPLRVWLNSLAPREWALLMQESEASPPLVALRALFLLMRPGVGLSPSEVRLYGLHQRPEQGGNTAAGTYIGEAPWVLLCRRLNRSSNQFLSDKLRLSYLLAGSKINAPRTLAYLGVRSPLLAVPELQSKAKLVRFLRQQATYPIFIKPLSGSQGQGCLAIEALEHDRLVLCNGERLPLKDAATMLRHRLGRKAIVQERLRPHPLLQPVCGETCATVRLLSSWDGEQVQLLAAILKLPSAGAVVDNLHSATSEHPLALAPVDPQTGELGAWRRFDGRCCEAITEPLPLRHIPQWRKCITMVQTLHRIDRGAVLLGWDVAITASGPSLVEANGIPSIHLLQVAYGRGFRDAQGRQLLAELEASARRIRHSRWKRAGRWLTLRWVQPKINTRI